MTPRRKTLPALSPKAPPELRPLFAAMAEILETGEGVRGDKLDRKLTLRDLLDGGLAKLRVPGNPDGGLTQPDGPQDMTVPPRPTGFAADGSFFGMIHLTWERPQEIYNNHALTNIYRSEEDNFATAQIIGREPGMFYSDVVRDDATVVDDPLNLPGYYYWITFSSTSGVEGAPNSPSGTFAQPLPDAAYLLGQLSGQLGESQLEQELQARIDLIDAGADVIGSVSQRVTIEAQARADAILAEAQARGAAITEEREARQSLDSSLSSRIDTFTAAVGDVAAAVQSEQQARVDADGALGLRVDTVQTVVDGHAASIQQQAQSINGLSAQFTLKTDVNGYVAGYGVYNDGQVADFAILADRFWIARPGAPASAVKPFMVIDGKVYIDSAFIRDASIQEGKLGPITFGKLFDSAGNPVTTLAGKLRADMLDVDSLRVGDANIAGVIQSSAVNSLGQRRWILDKNGGLTLNGSSSTGRMEVRDNVIKVFDSSGRLRVQLGDLTA